MKETRWVVMMLVCTMNLFCMDREAQPNSPDEARLLKRSQSISEDLERLELGAQEFACCGSSPAAYISGATKTPDALGLRPLIMPDKTADVACSSPITSPAHVAGHPVVVHRKSITGKDRRFLVFLSPLQLPSPAIDATSFSSICFMDGPESKKSRK